MKIKAFGGFTNMSERNKSFLITQVSLVANDQLTLFDNEYEDNQEGRNQLFRNVFFDIADNKKIVYKGRQLDNILLFSRKLTEETFYFKLAKQKKKEINAFFDDDIKAFKLDDFPHIDVFVNLRLQQILVEVKESIFAINEAIEILRRIIQAGTKKHNYSVFVSTVDDMQSFWERVDQKNADEILEIKFEMIAPNFFGNAGQAKDLVDDAKSNVNATEVSIILVNKKGKLKASMEHLDSFVRYSSFSGGWKVKVRKDGYVKTLKSNDMSLKKNIPEVVLDTIREISDNTNNIDAYNRCVSEIERMFVDRG